MFSPLALSSGEKTFIDARPGYKAGLMPWEDYVGASLPPDARLPQNFKTFDYYEGVTKTAVSAK